MTISISGCSRVPQSYSRQTPSGTAFADAMSVATSSVKVPSGDRAEISSAAVALSDQASVPSAVVDEASWNRLMQMPESERKAAVAKQADAISKAQGLPSGKYDYESMSLGQLSVVRANMVQNLGYSSEQLSATWSVGLQKADGGTSFGSSVDWTTPRNVLGEVSRDHDRLVSTNDFASAKVYEAAILAMKNTSVIDERNATFFKDQNA